MPQKLRIFIVEDEVIIRDDIRQVVIEAGYDVAGTVNSGEDALRELQTADANIILMDIVLNGQMSGIDTAEAINLSLGIPVVFLTSHSDDMTRFRAQSVNPAGFIVKPFIIDELNSVIDKLAAEGAIGIS